MFLNNFKIINKFIVIILLINACLNTKPILSQAKSCPQATCNLKALKEILISYNIINTINSDKINLTQANYCSYIDKKFINTKGSGYTALMQAVLNKNETLGAKEIQVLLNCGANPDLVDIVTPGHSNHTAYSLALSRKDAQAKNLLAPVISCITGTDDKTTGIDTSNYYCHTGAECCSKVCSQSKHRCNPKAIPVPSPKGTPVLLCGLTPGADCSVSKCCTSGLTCFNGKCISNTPPSLPCCSNAGDKCDPKNTTCPTENYYCSAGLCIKKIVPVTSKCGKENQDCCTTGDACNSGLTCDRSQTPNICKSSSPTQTCLIENGQSCAPDAGSGKTKCCKNTGFNCNFGQSNVKNICCSTDDTIVCTNDQDCCNNYSCKADPNNSSQKICQKTQTPGVAIAKDSSSWNTLDYTLLGVGIGAVAIGGITLYLKVIKPYRDKSGAIKRFEQSEVSLSKKDTEILLRLFAQKLNDNLMPVVYALESGSLSSTDMANLIELVVKIAVKKVADGHNINEVEYKILEAALKGGVIKQIDGSPGSYELQLTTVQVTGPGEDDPTIYKRLRAGIDDGAVLAQVASNWEDVLTSGSSPEFIPFGSLGPRGRPQTLPKDQAPTEEDRATLRVYIEGDASGENNGWDITGSKDYVESGTLGRFTSWRDFVTKNPELAREVYGVARYLVGDDQDAIQTEILRIFDNQGVISPELSTSNRENFFNFGADRAGKGIKFNSNFKNRETRILLDSRQPLLSKQFYDNLTDDQQKLAIFLSGHTEEELSSSEYKEQLRMRSEALLAFKDYQRRLQEAGVPDYADIPEGI